MRTAVYIDGFNLQYGVARPLDCRWVNLLEAFQRQFSADEIVRINYYEAMISGPQRPHQQAYVDALQSLPQVEVVLGEMKKKRRQCRVRDCSFPASRFWDEHEEKHTDVSIAISIVDDVHRARYEKIILVTADTDLVPALRLVKSVRPSQQVTLCIPALDKDRIYGSRPLAPFCDRVTRVDAEIYLQAQFADSFVDANGQSHAKPPAWRRAPLTAARDYKKNHAGRYLTTMPGWAK